MSWSRFMDVLKKRSSWIGGLSLLAVVGAGLFFMRPEKSRVIAPPAHPSGKVSPSNAVGSTRPTDGAEHANLAANFGRLPLSFEPNLGQTDPQVRFIARGNGYELFLTPAKAVVSLVAPHKPIRRHGIERATPSPAPAPASVVGMEFVGATDSAEIAGSDLLPGVSNYFIGDDPHHWATGVPHYARVSYRSVYPGISFQFSGQGPELGLGFTVAPGADPGLVHLRFTGATSVNSDAHGALAIAAANGALRVRRLLAYQEFEGKLQGVDASFVVRGDDQVVLSLGAYDHTRDLVIEAASADSEFSKVAVAATNHSLLLSLAWVPIVGIALAGIGTLHRKRLLAALLLCLSISGLAVLVACGNGQGGGGGGTGALTFGTYLGGSADDEGLAITVDGSGNVFVAGASASGNFPGSPAFAGGAGHDAFVTKLNASGAVQFSTFVGGNQDDVATGIALQGGNIFIVGNTQAGSSFPTPNHTFGTVGGQDAFIAILDSSGAVTTTTVLGGSAEETAQGIAVDGSGNVYIAGETFSTNFPTALPFQGALSGLIDGFVTKLTSNAAALSFSTYIGGTGSDSATGIALDGSNNVYISGVTTSAGLGLPATSTFGGGVEDGFAAEFSSTGSKVYFVYLGGTGDDVADAIAVDGPSGSAYITGLTASSNLATSSVFQASLKGGQDAFVAQVNSGGTIGFFTYFGGTSSGHIEEGKAIALDSSKNIYVTGSTDSTDLVLKNAITGGTSLQGTSDAFVVKLNPTGTTEIFATYYGGTLSEDLNGTSPGGAIAADTAGSNIYFTGTTASTSGLPLKAAAQGTFGGGAADAFVARITP